MAMGMFWVQGTSFGVCACRTRSLAFEDKTKSFIFGFGGSNSHCFKGFKNHPLVKVWRNSQTLWQDMKNDQKERKNV